jgi:prevent-host-death family protein
VKAKTIGIREFKSQLSSHLREVKEGATLVITNRGKPVARLVPVTSGIESKVKQLLESGSASWSGRRLSTEVPTVSVRGPKTVAEMLLEDRD